jgi:hypothetical protein
MGTLPLPEREEIFFFRCRVLRGLFFSETAAALGRIIPP